ncbi:4'-phosphopantetheinyl transferase family protein [Clostridium saccharoperbutylacetonicum]
MNLQKKVDSLVFKSNNESIETIICMSYMDNYDIAYSDVISFFSKEEIKYFENIKYDKRIKSYLLGRYASKNAVGKLLNINKLDEITIENGILGQPVVYEKSGSGVQVSISHCNNIGISIAYPPLTSIGIDIEKIDSEKYDLLYKVITDTERMLIEQHDIRDRHWMLTLMWTAREALAKCIKTGFTVPLDFFSIKDVFEKNQIHYGCFLNFTQYQFMCFEQKGYLISVVYPKKTELLHGGEKSLKLKEAKV